MKQLKPFIKYFLGQLLFFYKNLIVEKPIKKRDIKLAFFSNKIEKKPFFKLNSIGFETTIHVANSKENIDELNLDKRILVDVFDECPRTNANLYILGNKTFKTFYKSNISTDYFFIPFSEFLKNFTLVFKFLFKKKYFFKAVKKWHRFGLLFERKQKIVHHIPHRFIPYNYNRVQFLKALEREGVDYVVLRNFDFNEANENYTNDVDILINSQHIKILDNFLNNTIGLIPLDAYSVDGETETSYGGLPYYPKNLASKIIESRVKTSDDIFVPNTYYYAISYIYHLVFHKSLKSGIPIHPECKEEGFVVNNLTISYVKSILDSIDVKLEDITLNSLYNFLSEIKYIPSYDLVIKLKHLQDDSWYKTLEEKNKKDINSKYDYVKGLNVFFLREKAYSIENLNKVKEVIFKYGFNLLAHDIINESIKEKVSSKIRGGKWDVGDYKINAGQPIYYFVTFDQFCSTPKGIFKEKYPNLENRKALNLKEDIRNLLNKNFSQTMNSMHSSDDFYESIFYLETLGFKQEEIVELINKAKLIKSNYKDDYVVVNDLSTTMMRARIELIEYKKGLAVKKTYKKDKLDYFNREVWFLKKFANSNFVPKLLEVNDGYFVMEYFNNSKSLNCNVHISIKNIKQFQYFFEEIYKNNITILDINPANVIIDEHGDLKVIDFEYAQLYKEKPASIKSIYELGKIPIDKVEVYPEGHELIEDAYNVFWKNKLYMTKKQFMSIKNTYLLFVLKTLNKPIFNIKSKYRTLKKYAVMNLEKSNKSKTNLV